MYPRFGNPVSWITQRTRQASLARSVAMSEGAAMKIRIFLGFHRFVGGLVLTQYLAWRYFTS